MNTRAEIYRRWAPPHSTWSAWVKPLLFTELTEGMLDGGGLDARRCEPPAVPPADSGTALILDLPGEDALLTAVALAGAGYRPVPLFNGIPFGPGALVPTTQVADLLVTFSERVEAAGLGPDAPPAFVLDAGRMAGGRTPRPGDFDNRWMVFPQDFPSGGFLRDRGLKRVVVLQVAPSTVADDLAQVLRGYLRAGIEILVQAPDGIQARAATFPRCSWLRALFYRALVVLRLRRSAAGGFGCVVPVARSGGFS